MNLKTTVSKRNPYKLEKHRYLELKHYCLQYPLWKKAYSEILASSERYQLEGEWSDRTGEIASSLADLDYNIKLVEWTAEEADEYLAPFILKSVTEDIPFDKMNAKAMIFSGRDRFYDRYRKFFSLLNTKKGI